MHSRNEYQPSLKKTKLCAEVRFLDGSESLPVSATFLYQALKIQQSNSACRRPYTHLTEYFILGSFDDRRFRDTPPEIPHLVVPASDLNDLLGTLRQTRKRAFLVALSSDAVSVRLVCGLFRCDL
jgi:hypothetical protein